MRRFLVWAEVRRGKHIVEMPTGSTDAECEAACKEALDVLISNGDTGWNEMDTGEGDTTAGSTEGDR